MNFPVLSHWFHSRIVFLEDISLWVLAFFFLQLLSPLIQLKEFFFCKNYIGELFLQILSAVGNFSLCEKYRFLSGCGSISDWRKFIMDAWLSESLDTSSLSSDTFMCCCRSVRDGAEPRFKPTGSLGTDTSPMSLVVLCLFWLLETPISIVGCPLWVGLSCEIWALNSCLLFHKCAHDLVETGILS